MPPLTCSSCSITKTDRPDTPSRSTTVRISPASTDGSPRHLHLQGIIGLFLIRSSTEVAISAVIYGLIAVMPMPEPTEIGFSSVPVSRLLIVNGSSAVRSSPSRCCTSHPSVRPLSAYQQNTRFPVASNFALHPINPASQPSCSRRLPLYAVSIWMSGSVTLGAVTFACVHTSARICAGVAGRAIAGI